MTPASDLLARLQGAMDDLVAEEPGSTSSTRDDAQWNTEVVEVEQFSTVPASSTLPAAECEVAASDVACGELVQMRARARGGHVGEVEKVGKVENTLPAAAYGSAEVEKKWERVETPSPAPPPSPGPRPLSGVLAEWDRRFRALSRTDDPCPGFRGTKWPVLRAAALLFLSRNGEAAIEAGWDAIDLFGVHPVVGVARVESCGALVIGDGTPPAEITPSLIRFGGLTYYRPKTRPPAVPIWDFGREPGAPQ